MKKKLIYLTSVIMLFLLSVSFCLVSFAQEEEEPTTEAPKTTEYPDEPGRLPDTVGDSIVVMDAATGQVIYAKDAYEKRYPASITKVMTVLVALEHGNLEDTITMSDTAVWGIERDSSHIALDVGEEINFEDALYAVLLVSANEAAWGVAEHVAGTLDKFCDLMNQKAEELGCVSTHFVNANGLHDDEHYTCAYDMALIAREAIKNDKFREITATTHYIIPPTNKQEEERELWQNNKLIKEESDFYYPYCEGGKTGFTDQALGTLVTWAKKDDVELICVVMHSRPTSTTYTDSKALYEYYFNNYSYASPLTSFEFTDEDISKAEMALNNYFDGLNAGTLSLSVDTNARFLVRNGLNADNMVLTFNTDSIDEENKQVGTLSVGTADETYISLPVYYSGYAYKPIPEDTPTVEETTGPAVSKKESSHLFMKILITTVLLMIVALIVIIYLRVRYVRRRRAVRDRIRAQRRIRSRRR